MSLVSSNYGVIDSVALSLAIMNSWDMIVRKYNCFAELLLAELCVRVVFVLGLCFLGLPGFVAAIQDIARCFHGHSCFGISLLTPLRIAMIHPGCWDEASGWRDWERVNALWQPSWRTLRHRFQCWNEFIWTSCYSQSICEGLRQLVDRPWLMYGLEMSTGESCEHSHLFWGL